jgi:hypothetical protein
MRPVTSGPVGNRRRVVLLALGALVFLAGWGALVWFAILRAQDQDWATVTVAAVGAAASLFVALLLWTRLRAVRRGEPPAPARAARHKPSHRA